MTQEELEQTEIQHKLSITVPMYNEQESVEPLVKRVQSALADYTHPWELILVNDGSTDATWDRMKSMVEKHGDHIRVVDLQRNFGQTAAMQAGIDAARGDVIATLDGDLQNDPIDIPRMVKRLLEDDLDLIVGWRKDRKDNFWLRKVPSKIANRLIGRLTGVTLHDYGCSLKIYRASVVKNIRLYGEMHRFIPAWVATNTAPHRIKEEVVTHHARQYGTSKYGISRTLRVLLDLLAVYFFMKYSSRPGHFFGAIGLVVGALGSAMLGYLFVLKLFGEDIGGRPLLLVGILFMVMSMQFITTGVLSEVIMRTYYATKDTQSYVIRSEESSNSAQTNGWKYAATLVGDTAYTANKV